MAGHADATREQRLKAALKSNMARRKAQGRARAPRPSAAGETSDKARDMDEETDGMDERRDG